jgi:hypothetical protein
MDTLRDPQSAGVKEQIDERPISDRACAIDQCEDPAEFVDREDVGPEVASGTPAQEHAGVVRDLAQRFEVIEEDREGRDLPEPGRGVNMGSGGGPSPQDLRGELGCAAYALSFREPEKGADIASVEVVAVSQVLLELDELLGQGVEIVAIAAGVRSSVVLP